MISRLKFLLFENRAVRQTITKNIFWLSMGQIVSRLFRGLIIIYAARVLGATEYGVFAYVLGLAGFFMIFTDIGVSQILTREVAKKPNEDAYYFATTFWIKSALLIFTAALIIFLAPHFSKIEAAKKLLPFIALLPVFDGLRELSMAFFRAKEKMELEALVTSVTNLTMAIFGFVILSLAANAKTLTFTYIFSAGIGAVAGIIILRKYFGKIISFFKKDLVKGIIASAWPFALLGVTGIFMLNIDIVMLGFLKTSTEVGLYSAGQKIIGLLYTLPAILAISFFPALSRFIGQKDNLKAKLLMEQGMAVIFLLAIPIAVGGVVLSKEIINFLYSQQYLPAAFSFQILILTILLIFPSTILANYILAYDQQRKMTSYAILGSVGNIVLNAILIPFFGIAGAAIATLLSQIIYYGLIWRLAKKINNFLTLCYLKKIIAAAIIMGIAAFLLNQLGLQVLINIFISAGIYLGMLYLFKEKILEEILILFKKFKEAPSQ